MPLQATSGAASYDAFGGGVPFEPTYIEEYFSTWLYSGNSSTQTITNGIDLSTKGGLVWFKCRNEGYNHMLFDTERGSINSLCTNNTNASVALGGDTTYNSNGFTIAGTSSNNNISGYTYASWSFAKAPKFFDCVTYTGNGTAGRTVAHNLGSVPGCIIIKRTDAALNWYVYHRYDPTKYLVLNQTAAAASFAVVTATSDTTFTLPADGSTNGNGSTYVAYIFAHNAGGFGLTGTDNVISCGSFTTGAGSGFVSLGWEPQYVLTKRTDGVGGWVVVDSMRGMAVDNGAYPGDAILLPNASNAEAMTTYFDPQATGFNFNTFGSSQTWIYIAIRRGPMKVPTTGTSVFAPALGQSPNPNYVSGFPVDFAMSEYRVNGSNSTGSRLQGSNIMDTASTGSENSDVSTVWDFMNGFYTGGRTSSFVSWMFRRAPGFFDVVVAPFFAGPVNHNLGVVPELVIAKSRVSDGSGGGWFVWVTGFSQSEQLYLNTDAAKFTNPVWGPMTTTQIGTQALISGSSGVYYAFASAPGVSKVGSYTGTGTTQTINCGFTGGARFVLIKATSTTGNWLVWDSARGIVAGNDPYLALNSTAAEVTNTDWVDIAATGFELSNAGGNLVNSNGVSYIFLAIS
jgi:hypothetical protein